MIRRFTFESWERRRIGARDVIGHDCGVQTSEGLRAAIVEVLGAEVLDRAAIADAIIERGLVSRPEASLRHEVDRVLQFDPCFSEVVDGIVFVPALVAGTTWTVWVDPEDAAEDFVRMHPQLAPLGWWLISAGVNLVDPSGEVLGSLDTDGIWLDDRDTDVVFGPDGWLDGLAGGWASVAVAQGGLCWSPCAVPPTPSERQTAALRVGFGRHVPTLVDAAGFASDRGDAVTAYRWLRQASVVDPPVDEEDEWSRPDIATLLVEEVAGFALHRPRLAAGRNDACPCGSGRKYKVCHLGREQHSLADRSAWLYDKARRFL